MPKNFPFRQEDLLTASSFTSYCEARGIKVKESDLENFHKQGLLYPCIRVFPGVSVLIKVKLPEHNQPRYIYPDDFKKFKGARRIDNKKYYSYCSISYGTKDWLDFYLKRKMADYPIEDKKFSKWEKYRLKDAGFATDMNKFKDYRLLLYSKHQIHMLENILKWRPFNITFNYPPSEKLLGTLKEDIPKWLSAFDKNFKEKRYEEYLKFFGILMKIQDMNFDCHKKTVENTEFSLKEYSEKDREKEWINDYTESRKALIAEEYSQKARSMLKKCSVDARWIDEWREKILTQGISSHENLSIFDLARTKYRLSNFHKRGRLQFMFDCFEISSSIEHFFEFCNYEKFISIQKLFWNIDKFKICAVCGKDFLPKRSNQKTCSSKECTMKNKLEIKRNKRKTKEYKN
ncbi:MAG: hypothetical protein WCV72_02620 [Patescibacteria group bacterium]|jgi:hypothetical protein